MTILLYGMAGFAGGFAYALTNRWLIRWRIRRLERKVFKSFEFDEDGPVIVLPPEAPTVIPPEEWK